MEETISTIFFILYILYVIFGGRKKKKKQPSQSAPQPQYESQPNTKEEPESLEDFLKQLQEQQKAQKEKAKQKEKQRAEREKVEAEKRQTARQIHDYEKRDYKADKKIFEQPIAKPKPKPKAAAKTKTKGEQLLEAARLKQEKINEKQAAATAATTNFGEEVLERFDDFKFDPVDAIIYSEIINKKIEL